MRSAGRSFEFGAFRLEPDERRLCRGSEPVAITPKAFDLLVILVENADRLLKKEDLMERLWPGVFVEEVNLAQNVSAIRRALGGDGRDAYIQTVAGTGYRFVATVRRPLEPPGDQRTAPADDGVAARFDRERLLVLPFRMLKADPDLDFLAFSLPDAMTAELSTIDSLIVRSSLVAAKFAGDTPDLARIARNAHVDFVVSGTVLRVGNELRVSAQLSDAAAGTLLWSHTAQAPIADLFQLQDSLSRRITESLAIPLTARDRQYMSQDVPASPRAYELYLRANAHFWHPRDWTIARDLYTSCVAADLQFAPAWARLGRCYRLTAKFEATRMADVEVWLARAEEALRKAFAINPNLPAAHSLYTPLECDLGRADDAVVRLLGQTARRPADAELFAGLVYACRYCGLLDASLAAHERAQQLDPSLPTSAINTLWMMGRYDAALDPRFAGTSYIPGLTLATLGRREEAIRYLREHPEPASNAAGIRYSQALLDWLEGRPEAALATLDSVLAVNPDPESRYYLSRLLVPLGQVDRALFEMERIADMGFACYPVFANDSWLDPLRAHDRFRRTLQRIRERHDRAGIRFTEADGARLIGLA